MCDHEATLKAWAQGERERHERAIASALERFEADARAGAPETAG